MKKNLSARSGKGPGVDLPIIDLATDTSTELTLRDILRMLKRRRMMLISIFLTGMVGVAVFLSLVTPKYAAKGQLLIGSRAGQVRNINSVIATPVSNIADVPNEIQILKSRVLAAKVIDKLGLRDDPEFSRGSRKTGASKSGPAVEPKSDSVPQADPAVNPGQAPQADRVVMADKAAEAVQTPKPVQVVRNDRGTLALDDQASDKAGGPVDSAGTATDANAAEANKGTDTPGSQSRLDNGVPSAVLDAFQNRLDASAERRSRVIDVRFESTDPKKATRIVNTLLHVYLDYQVRYQKKALITATNRLQKIVDQLRIEVSDAEKVVQEFRAKTRLVEPRGGTNITGQQLGELNSRLVEAQAEETAATARLNQMLSLLKSPGSMQTAPEILRSNLIQRLREKETELLRQRSEFGSRYGPKHPSMIKNNNEIQDLREKIQDESNKIVESLSNELAVVRARTVALTTALRDLETKAIGIGKDRNALSELERELDSKRNQHQTFFVRLRETSAQQEMIEPTARIVSYAEVPAKPSYPRKGKTLALATMFLALLAGVSTIVAEAMRRTVETTNEVERALRLRPLGVLPKLRNLERLLKRPEDLFSNRGNILLTQSIRNIRSALYLSNGSKEPNSILVTSALPGEGKTTFALCYASFCAANGQRVLLIDCNFTQPTVHEIFATTNDIGLADVLANEDLLKDAIRTLPDTGFDYISTGRNATGKPELLDAAAMQRLLESVAWDYDVVIIDSSPVLSMANAHVLAKLVESTIFVVRWRQTRRDLAAAAIKRLRSVGVTSISGFLLSNVNPRKFEGPENLFDPLVHDGEPGDGGLVRRSLRRIGMGGGASRAA